ncbi:lipoprotein NlpD [Noviherbaspirillum humi]|uniref:Lipoprotein NlpD n=2 Tax=Noviherbaspirillum humi TaxID=1688639 RepID=A0A239FQ05_9BURK|nr:lipoprotein NlpD [Noviherbaspirillum humi]
MLLAIVSGCSTTRNQAPVVERPVPSRNAEAPRPLPAPAPAQPQPPKQADTRGFYTVKRGDTLIQIALEFGQNYRDLVIWNNLSNPNDIKVDQVLRVLPPDAPVAGAAPSGVQTGSVVPNSTAESRPLPNGAAASTHKTGPRGEKRAFSESALAELNKPDATAPTVPSKTEPPKVSDSKTPERPAESAPPATDEEGIAWIWPAEGKVVAGFSDGRKGIDIAGKPGQPVLAAGAGRVLYAGSGIRGYGNLVILKHSTNYLSAYAHNKAIFVKEDQTVSKGQKIAEMGSSDSDSVKLHFEIRHQGKPVDPSKFLPAR